MWWGEGKERDALVVAVAGSLALRQALEDSRTHYGSQTC